jgi:serine protease Do
MQSLTDDLRKQFGVEDGVLISEVLKGDPAETAGVEAGDVILKVNGKDVRTPHDVQFAVLAAKPGDKLKLAITRRGKSMDIEVVARLKDTKDGGVTSVGDKDDLLNQVGLALEDTEEGVVVSGVVAGSPAQAADIWRGDRILEVNRQPVKTAKDVLSALAVDSDEVAVLYIDRRGSKFFRSVALAGEKK